MRRAPLAVETAAAFALSSDSMTSKMDRRHSTFSIEICPKRESMWKLMCCYRCCVDVGGEDYVLLWRLIDVLDFGESYR